MRILDLLPSTLIGAVSGARSMTPLAALSAARQLGRRAPGRLALLDHPAVRIGALALGAGEMMGDKWKGAPDRTSPLGLLARIASAGLAGAAMAPRGRERLGAAAAIGAALPIAYLTLFARQRAGARVGQTLSGLAEDALAVASAAAVVLGRSRPA